MIKMKDGKKEFRKKDVKGNGFKKCIRWMTVLDMRCRVMDSLRWKELLGK